MGPEGQLLALKEHGLGQPTGHSSFAPRKKEAQLYHLPVPVPVHHSPYAYHGSMVSNDPALREPAQNSDSHLLTPDRAGEGHLLSRKV